MAGSTGPNIVEDGLVLAVDAANKKSYPGSGTTWNDLSGNGYDGTLINGPTFNSEKGGSLVFDGSNDIVLTSNNLMSSLGVFSGVDNDVAYSMECVFKLNSYPTGVGTSGMSLMGHASSGGIGLQVFNSGGYYINFGYRSNNNITFTNQAISTNTWYHTVCTRPTGGSSVTVSYYINGILKSSGTTDLRVDYTAARFQIGSAESRIGYLNGHVAFGRVYNRVLSADEVLQNYNATKTRFI